MRRFAIALACIGLCVTGAAVLILVASPPSVRSEKETSANQKPPEVSVSKSISTQPEAESPEKKRLVSEATFLRNENARLKLAISERDGKISSYEQELAEIERQRDSAEKRRLRVLASLNPSDLYQFQMAVQQGLAGRIYISGGLRMIEELAPEDVKQKIREKLESSGMELDKSLR
jgi:hypothetical protein